MIDWQKELNNMPRTKEKLLKDILRKNPQISRNAVIAGCEFAERLRKSCLRRRGYRIALPMTGKNVRSLDDEAQDYRTIRLQHI